MKPLPPKAVPGARWPFLCLFALSFLFITMGFTPAAAQKPKAAMLNVTVEEGKTTRAEIGIQNTCTGPYNFEMKSDFPHLRFEEPTAAIPVAPGLRRSVYAEFSAATLKKGTYSGTLTWGCLGCPPAGTGCSAKRTIILIKMTVLKATRSSGNRPGILSHGDLLKRFLKVVDNALENNNARLTDGARVLLSEMLDKGASKLGDKHTLDQLKQAEGNLMTFIKKAVEIAKEQAGKKTTPGMSFAPASQDKIEIDEEVIKKTKESICPLFPFC